MKIPYLIAVKQREAGTHGVVFDRIGGVQRETHLYLVAWADGRITSEDPFDITFRRFLSSETEANIWLLEEEKE